MAQQHQGLTPGGIGKAGKGGEKKATQGIATGVQKVVAQNTESRDFLNYPLAEFSHSMYFEKS